MLFAALVFYAAAPAVGEHRTERLRTQCFGDRCVVYDRYGRRIGTVTQEVGGRVAVRDREGRLREKITVQGSTVIVNERFERARRPQ